MCGAGSKNKPLLEIHIEMCIKGGKIASWMQSQDPSRIIEQLGLARSRKIYAAER